MNAKSAKQSFESGKYCNEDHVISFMERNKEHIIEARDDRNMRFIWHVARFGSQAEKLKIIEALGTRICEVYDQYGRSIANELSRNANGDPTKVQAQIMETLGRERLESTRDSNGYSIAHRLAYEGTAETHYRLISILGERISSITDCYGKSVADEINSHATAKVKEMMQQVLKEKACASYGMLPKSIARS